VESGAKRLGEVQESKICVDFEICGASFGKVRRREQRVTSIVIQSEKFVCW